MNINLSIVLFLPEWSKLISLLEELVRVQNLNAIYLIDNSPAPTDSLPDLPSNKIHYIFPGKNLGYGAGHNIAIRESIYDDIPLHLVMNSDIQVKAQDIDALCTFMRANPQVGSLMPRVVYPNGDLQYLCKLLPTPIDVFARRFLPKSWTKRRMARYEMHSSGYNQMMNIPYLSGCFMLLRTRAVAQARLFDERFFMYPEDMDLTRRIHRDYLTLFVPEITIVHDHTQSSYHSPRMLWVHIINMCKYFNKWGWFFDKERRIMNQICASQYLH